MLLTDPANIFYFTGFRGSAGVAYVEGPEAVLWVDPRYTLQAREQARGIEVVEVRTGLIRFAGRWLRRGGRQRVGYEDGHLSCRDFLQLRQEAGKTVTWVAEGKIGRALRAVKDEEEIQTIRRACAITSKVYEEVLPRVRPGVKELDVAAEIEYRMKREGAEAPAFETIVASGSRTALPHARPSSKLLENGDLVILDLGAILCGYASDLTRTLYLGRPERRIRRLFQAVQAAQLKAIQGAEPGVEARRVDMCARRVLAERHLDKFFTHSTGHGVGIEIHEDPRIAKLERTKLRAGHVITVEPGVYLEGVGGVRIEDTLLVTPRGQEILTGASKDSWILE